MKIDPYLKRLQLSEKPKKTLSFLEKLQSQHVRQIPFENWDILQQIPLSLHMEDLYEKVIHRRRGGVCFELNGLFHALLVQLGFKAHLMAGTVYHGDLWGIEESHTIILVQLDAKQYLVDVGFGGKTPRKPIPLSGEIVQDLDGDYRIIPDPSPHSRWILQKKEEQEWEHLYRFRTDQWNLHDFSSACEYIQHSPDSIFNKEYFFMKVTENGRKTLKGNSLTIVENGVKTKKVIPSEQLDQVAQTFFDE